MKTAFSLVILFCLSLVSFGQIQSADQPIVLRNNTNCELRVFVHCSDDGSCDPADTFATNEQFIPESSSVNLNQCSGSYYFAYIKFSFDDWMTTHVVGFDPDLSNDCAGLTDCDNYSIPYGYPQGTINENCVGSEGEIRVNGMGPGQATCTIWFTGNP